MELRQRVADLGASETERKRVGEALRESEEKLSAIFEAAAGAIIITDLEGHIVGVNETACDRLGYSHEEELIGQEVLSFVAERDRGKVAESLRRTLEVGHTRPIECAFLNKQGKQLDTELTAGLTRVTFGNPTGFIITMKDVTDTERASQALRESEEFNSSLLSNSPIAIVVVNPDTSIRYVNPALEKLTGFTSAELVGRKFPYPWWTKEKTRKIMRNAKTQADFERVLTTEERKDEECRLKKNGEQFWVELTSKPIMRGGQFQYHLSCWVDITERKRAEEQLEKSRQELAELSRHLESRREEERARIALEIHDELGQMLTGLKMDLAWLTKRIAKDEKLMHQKAKSMLKLLDLTMQSVKRISTELRPRLLDDLGLVAAIEWQAQEFEKITGIKCEVACYPEDITLDHECSTTIFRVFQETLTNIFRHANATKVNVRFIGQRSKIMLRVRDNGKGITEDDFSSPKAFGLIGMRERAYSQGGKLQISGIPGKGTTVVLTIPLSRRAKTNDKDTYCR